MSVWSHPLLSANGDVLGTFAVYRSEPHTPTRAEIAVVTALEEIAALGVRIVIDDFGTGYSSIARLGELPIVGIKIDKAFTLRLGADASVEKVAGAIIDLAHALNLQVVAEGVETEAALVKLGALDCDLAQGYHIAMPMPCADLAAVLAGEH